MSAEEALAYGLIDEIVQPNDEKLRQLSLPPPSQVYIYISLFLTQYSHIFNLIF
jgi:hypothetical protein